MIKIKLQNKQSRTFVFTGVGWDQEIPTGFPRELATPTPSRPLWGLLQANAPKAESLFAQHELIVMNDLARSVSQARRKNFNGRAKDPLL